MRLHTKHGVVNIISIYAPTLVTSAEEKDGFYNQLDNVLFGVCTSERIFVLGDFNGRVGKITAHGRTASASTVWGK